MNNSYSRAWGESFAVGAAVWQYHRSMSLSTYRRWRGAIWNATVFLAAAYGLARSAYDRPGEAWIFVVLAAL